MNQPTITDDVHAEGYAAVHVEELDHWAWLLGRIEDWLLHAGEDTIADWAAFAGPCGEDIDEVTDTLGRATVRLHDLAKGRP
ncbi:MAG: hypothetical protein WD250_16300 [Egibacteraceae bacterium]